MSGNDDIDQEANNGEWKKAKGKCKGKKNWTKNARTITLQNFFAENGGPYIDGDKSDYNDFEESGSRTTMSSSAPYLNEDEQVIQKSICSFFVDLLKRLGPLKRDDIRIQSEYESLTKEGHNVIRRFGSLRNLLILDDNINLVDDYICVSTDTETAQNLTINRVMKHPNVFGQISKPVASGNVWFKSTNGSETLNVDPILQLPEMDSLFNYNVKAAVVKPIKPPTPPGPPPQAPISKSSSPLIIPDSFPVPPPQCNGVEKLSGQPLLSTGLLVPTSFSKFPSAATNIDVENLQKKLHQLTQANAELMAKMEEKDKHIQELVKIQLMDGKFDMLKKNLALEKELNETREEVKEWRQKAEKSRDSSQLVISLQKQLESEKLNARNLKHQIEMERIYSNKINEKYSSLMKQMVLTPPPPNNGLNVSLPASSSSSLISPKTSLESPTYSLSSIWSASKSDSMTSATRSAFSASTPGGLPSRKFNVPPPPSQNNLGLNKSAFGNVVLMNSDSALNRGTKTTDTLKGSVPIQYYTPPPNVRNQYNHFVYDNRNMPVTPPRNSQNPHRVPQNTVLLSDITNANARFPKMPPTKTKPQAESNPSPPKAKTPPSGRTPKKPGQSERKPNY